MPFQAVLIAVCNAVQSVCGVLVLILDPKTEEQKAASKLFLENMKTMIQMSKDWNEFWAKVRAWFIGEVPKPEPEP